MDSATLVVATIIILLQAITLVIILIDRKKKSPEKPGGLVREEDRMNDRAVARDRFRRPGPQQSGTPQWEQKPRRPQETPGPTPGQPVAPIDKSLRDINLRLKSAERDQDRARRDIRTGMGDVSSMRGRDRDRDRYRDRGRRHDRDRRDRRDMRPRAPYQERSGAPGPLPGPAAPQLHPQSDAEVREPQLSEAPLNPAQAEPGAQAQPRPPVESESIEHGRKVMVKRRALKSEEEERSSETPTGAESSFEVEKPADQANQPEGETAEKQETSFGRR